MKRKIKSPMRLRSYVIVSDAVESGIARGWNRAHKHTDTPDPTVVQAEIETAVMDALCEVIDFDRSDE